MNIDVDDSLPPPEFVAGLDFGTYASGPGYARIPPARCSNKLGPTGATKSPSGFDASSTTHAGRPASSFIPASRISDPVVLEFSDWPDHPVTGSKTRTALLYCGQRPIAWGWSAFKLYSDLLEKPLEKPKAKVYLEFESDGVQGAGIEVDEDDEEILLVTNIKLLLFSNDPIVLGEGGGEVGEEGEGEGSNIVRVMPPKIPTGLTALDVISHYLRLIGGTTLAIMDDYFNNTMRLRSSLALPSVDDLLKAPIITFPPRPSPSSAPSSSGSFASPNPFVSSHSRPLSSFHPSFSSSRAPSSSSRSNANATKPRRRSVSRKEFPADGKEKGARKGGEKKDEETAFRKDLVLWTLTVPATWSHAQRMFMRRCAFQAGLIPSLNSNRLMIVLEPEAAAVASLFKYTEVSTASPTPSIPLSIPRSSPSSSPSVSPSSSSKSVLLDVGDEVFVIDCGGGTADLTLHDVVNQDGILRLRESVIGGGGPFGSTLLDSTFNDWAKDSVGSTAWDSWIESGSEKIRFLEEWEKRKKEMNDYLAPPPPSASSSHSPIYPRAPPLYPSAAFGSAIGLGSSLRMPEGSNSYNSTPSMLVGSSSFVFGANGSLQDPCRELKLQPRHFMAISNPTFPFTLPQQLRDSCRRCQNELGLSGPKNTSIQSNRTIGSVDSLHHTWTLNLKNFIGPVASQICNLADRILEEREARLRVQIEREREERVKNVGSGSGYRYRVGFSEEGLKGTGEGSKGEEEEPGDGQDKGRSPKAQDGKKKESRPVKVLLVGGFSSSQYLQSHLLHHFNSKHPSKVRLFIPSRPDTAVLKGAVLFGCDPLYIASRRSRLCYGVRMNRPWTAADEMSRRKYAYPRQMYGCALDCFQHYICKDEMIAVQSVLAGRYNPFLEGQKEAVIDMCTSRFNDVSYTLDPRIRPLLSLRLKLPEKWEESNKVKSGFGLPIEVRMKFGSTEIQIQVRELLKGTRIEGTIEFDSEGFSQVVEAHEDEE